MIPNDSYARITFDYTGPPVPEGAATVLCFRDLDGGGSFTTDHADAAISAFALVLLPLLDNGVTCPIAHVKIGPDETGISYDVAVGESGAAGGEAAPPNTAYLITKNSVDGGRRGKGRMFLPGVNEDLVNEGGIIDPTRVALLQTACDDFLAQLAGDEDNPTMLVLEHGEATHWVLVDGQPRRVPEPDTAPAPSDITSLTVSNKVATQRRRLR